MMTHDPPPVQPGSVLEFARWYVAAGLSVFPVKPDGSKSPLFAGWRQYAETRATDGEITRWFVRGDAGIGIPGGPASGNLVVFDFETLDSFRAWAVALNADERAALDGTPVIRTPKGGRHVYVRTAEPVKGCKLARTAAGVTVVETRGSQHFVVAPGSPPAVHPTGKPYTIARAGWFDGRPSEPMSLEIYHALTVRAASLNEYRKPAARQIIGDTPREAAGDRPGDHFNARVDWGDILSPHGWRVYRSTETTTYWSRPGKSPPGISASSGFCKGPSGNDLMFVFSTSAAPFESEVSYSRFGAYALLNHRGDFRAATRALAIAGYGLPARKGVAA